MPHSPYKENLADFDPTHTAKKPRVIPIGVSLFYYVIQLSS